MMKRKEGQVLFQEEAPENVQDAVERALAKVVRIMDLVAENPANFKNAIQALEDAHTAINNSGSIADKKRGIKLLRNHPKRTEVIQSLAHLKHQFATATPEAQEEMLESGHATPAEIKAFEDMLVNIFPTQLDKEMAKLAANDNEPEKAEEVA